MSSLRDLTPPDLQKHLTTYREALQGDADQPGINASMGICFLRLGRHEDAITHLRAAMRDQLADAEIYFFAAVAELRGRKAFLTPLKTVREVESLLDAAIRLEDRGIFFYLLAYVAADFYERKSLNAPQHWTALLDRATQQGASHADIELLFDLLGVENPFN